MRFCRSVRGTSRFVRLCLDVPPRRMSRLSVRCLARCLSPGAKFLHRVTVGPAWARTFLLNAKTYWGLYTEGTLSDWTQPALGSRVRAVRLPVVLPNPFIRLCHFEGVFCLFFSKKKSVQVHILNCTVNDIAWILSHVSTAVYRSLSMHDHFLWTVEIPQTILHIQIIRCGFAR